MTQLKRCSVVGMWCCWFACLAPAAAPPGPLTQADLLRRLIDVDRLTTPPAGETSLLFSSFDRAAKTIENGRYTKWDANNDFGQFYGKADGWDIMADIEGPGCIWRIWIDKPDGELRIELDGQELATGPMAESLDISGGERDSKEPPLTYRVGKDGALVSYVPLGFSKRARVLARGFQAAYQIDATRFADSQPVEPTTKSWSPEALAARAAVAAAFNHGLQEVDVLRGRKTLTMALQEDVAPGGKLSEEFPGKGPVIGPKGAEAPPKGGTVRAFYVSLTDSRSPRDIYALRSCILRIYFDGQQTPNVEAPLCDFFGSGFERLLYRGAPMGIGKPLDMPSSNVNESLFMYCYFPMPFRESLRIEIENRYERPIGLMVYARIDQAAPAPSALQFFARYRAERASKSFDYPILETNGPGRVVGCVLNVDTPRRDWWGDGDHKVWIDGEAFPSIAGTGTADFFGDRAPARAAAQGLHGVVRTGPHGKSSLYRWMLADSVNFQKSVRFVIENAQPPGIHDVDVSSVAYWYAPRGAQTGKLFAPLTERETVPAGLRFPGGVEIEGNILSEQWGQVVKARFRPGIELSGDATAMISQTGEPVRIKVPVEKAGRYRLKLRVEPRQVFETITVTTDDGKPVGTVAHQPNQREPYTVGELDLAAPLTVLRVQVSKPASLDCWVLEPLGAGD